MNNEEISKDDLLDEMLKLFTPNELLARIINILTPIELRYFFAKIKKHYQEEKEANHERG